jgi:hypothetical protein
MSSFFSTASNNNHLLVSPQFWIFWSFAIPLTAVVLVIYILWVQRAEVRVWYAGKMRGHPRLQKMLRSRKQRERDLEKGEVSGQMASSQEDRKQV